MVKMDIRLLDSWRRGDSPLARYRPDAAIALSNSKSFDDDERRLKVRFPFQFGVRYRTFGAGAVAGTGQTVNFSSSGILVTARPAPKVQVDELLEAIVEWPILLNGAIQIQFVALGRVVRATGQTFAMSFARYEFRTIRKQPRSVLPDPSRRELG